ncbi:MAG TPA: hypothetical protein VHM88_15925, partial [Candidatus Acidoferrales bacterium]|nr:hypothetical protein [Candidatus Acidoferrales bacterium]
MAIQQTVTSKSKKVLYWSATGFVVLAFLLGGLTELMHEPARMCAGAGGRKRAKKSRVRILS